MAFNNLAQARESPQARLFRNFGIIIGKYVRAAEDAAWSVAKLAVSSTLLADSRKDCTVVGAGGDSRPSRRPTYYVLYRTMVLKDDDTGLREVG